MECTQRLECTQEICVATQSDRISPAQIGLLGICGKTYPVIKGPNKIGRDPQTCSIILNLNSVSRQHAVINILNNTDFMLMDLDSANKTKLMGQTLQPYIPQPLHHGDTVQFGEIFGVFRLLKEDDDLPMTQALDILDTPIPAKQKLRGNMVTTVPESPDVSDKDDSFIVPSQPKGPPFQSPKFRNFIKAGTSIQSIGSNKIDNIYWNSSKKSNSLNLDDFNVSLKDSIPSMDLEDKDNKVSNDKQELEAQIVSVNKKPKISKESIYTANTQLSESIDIHTANTQLPESIYTANTQMPHPVSSPSIHVMDTQMPHEGSPSIHTMNTQMPYQGSSIHNLNTQLPAEFTSPSIHNIDTQIPGGNLPQVCKTIDQTDIQLDLYAKKYDDSILNAETELFPAEVKNVPANSRNNNDSPSSIKLNKLNSSNDEVLFDDVDQPYEEELESQAILTEDIDLPINRLIEPDFEFQSQIVVAKSAQRNMRINSDSSVECDGIDILSINKQTVKKVGDDDTTDCEEDDNMIELKIDKKLASKDTFDNFEDVLTQVIKQSPEPLRENNSIDFEDMPTQVLDCVNIIKNDVITEKASAVADIDFADLPTQVLDDDDVPLKKKMTLTTNIITEKNCTFKIPCNTAIKGKKVTKTPKIKPIKIVSKPTSNNEENKYYQDTQDIYDDLCSQKLDFLNTELINKTSNKKEKLGTKLLIKTSVTDINSKMKDENDVKNLSNQDVSQAMDVDNPVARIKKVSSDGSSTSDVENTPTKRRSINFMDLDRDLPNSQEIKTSVRTKQILTESASDSETENNSEEQYTPILFRKKKQLKSDVKLDLTKKFNLDTLPSRVITRIRKPTAKLVDNQNKKVKESILKPKFFAEQESEIDKDIITENISRLKTKNDKTKNAKAHHSNNESKQVDAVEVSIAEGVKRVRSGRNKHEEVAEAKFQIKTKPDHSKYLNSNTKNNHRKREPTLTISSSNQSTSVVESKDKTHITKKSKEIDPIDSTKIQIETKRTRSIRHAKTIKADEKSPDKDRSDKPKRKYTRATKSEHKKELKEFPKNESTSQRKKSPEKEIRRSKRQRPVKEEVKKESLPKSILKKSLDQEKSTTYNMSMSNSDTSRSFKRSTMDDSEAPYPKRTRSAFASKSNAMARATPLPGVKTQYVLFTAFPHETVKVKLEKMGAIVVTDVMQCTVLLTKQIKRTFKLLCAVGLGKPIVGPAWVQACADANMIVDPWLHVMKDEVAEKRFHFNLERTLTQKRNFLNGYNVSSTPKVKPEPHEMKLIVECSGGTWKEGGVLWICISVPEDAVLWPALRQKGAVIVSTEFILGGVLRQRVDIGLNRFK